MTAYTFDQIIDFTRTSAATYVANTGFVTQTPASRNLLTYTQEFDNAAWTKTRASAYPFDPSAATYGSELVTNGTFDSGTTGWSGNANATLSVVSGALRVTAIANGTAYATQAITTVPGLTYRITVTYVTDAITGNAFLYAGTAAGSGNIGNLTIGSTLGAHTLYFVATGTTTYISVSNSTLGLAGEYMDFDNISVREVIGGLITAPDGTLTGDKVVEDTTASNSHFIGQSSTYASGATYALSIYAKASERNWFCIQIPAAIMTTARNVFFNLSTGVLGTVDSGLTAAITPAGGGWYRCAVTFTTTAGAAAAPALALASADNTTAYTGNGTSGLYLWGAQLEAVPDANLVLGSELVSNGTFDSATGWTVGTGWTIGSGVASAAGSTAGGLFTSIAGYTTGKTYRVELTKTGSANLTVYIRSGAAVSTTASGTVVLYATAGSSGSIGLEFYLGTGGGTIDNITVKEITGTTGMPTTYTRNVGGVYPPRFDYDPVTLAPRGLLIEEQRTNLLLRSEEFDNASWSKITANVAANAATSPDGTIDADGLTATGGSAQHYINQSLSFTSGTAYTLSVFAKKNTLNGVQLTLGSGAFSTLPYANFDLNAGTSFTSNCTATMTNFGNGWYRCTMTATATSTASTTGVIGLARDTTESRLSSFDSDGNGIYLWGAQLEAGAFATSYIPTVASQVTRTADVATVTGANFSRWYNQSEGTLLVEATTSGDILSSYSAAIVDTGVTNIIGTDIDSSGAYRLRVTAASVNQALVAVVYPIAANTTYKLAGAYRVNDFAASANGGPAGNDTSGTVPTGLSYFAIGSNSATGASSWNGHIRRIRYYPTRLSNTQLQALTA